MKLKKALIKGALVVLGLFLFELIGGINVIWPDYYG